MSLLASVGGTASQLLARTMETGFDDEQFRNYEELSIDEDLSLLERVKRYSLGGTTLQKIVFVREIPNCIEEAGLELALAEVLPLLAQLATEQEATVRQMLAQQLPRVVQLLVKNVWPEGAAEARAKAGSVAGPPALAAFAPEQTSKLDERAYRA
ncbi:hypothetical protein T492DRAFT_901713, partial [Pavlovales sp. CCMP2436]